MTDPMTPTPDPTATALQQLAKQIHPDSSFIETLEHKLMSQHVQSTQPQKHLRRWIAAAVLILLLTSFLTVPPLRALAQQILNAFFNNAASDQQTITFGEFDMNLVQHMTLEEADQYGKTAGYDVLLPTYLPDGFEFVEADVISMAQLVMLKYQNAAVKINITEQPLTEISPQEVGASAEIQDMSIQRGDQTVIGQYVQGSWVFNLAPGTPTPAPGQALSDVGEWRSDIPERRLQWQENGIFYEVSAFRDDFMGTAVFEGHVEPNRDLPSPEDLVAIADGLQ